VGAEAYGAFKLADDQFEKVLGAFPVNAGAVTQDSSVWIGTNTGLHQLKDKQWVRYNEEGVTNFEIPDNIVERLLVDNLNNLWVILSEGITVFEAKQHSSSSNGHIPSLKFIGKPQNSVYSVIYVNQQGYVFATGMGLLFLPTGQSDHLSKLEQSPTTDIVANRQMLHLIQLPGKDKGTMDFSHPVILRSDKRNNFWLVDQQGISMLTNKNIAKLLQDLK
jgi:ligand-binding sensor domain-containing protein